MSGKDRKRMVLVRDTQKYGQVVTKANQKKRSEQELKSSMTRKQWRELQAQLKRQDRRTKAESIKPGVDRYADTEQTKPETVNPGIDSSVVPQ